jgi:16S rRNA U1498 N3-methylase RsmE
MLFILSIVGYALVVLKEKYFLRQNVIFIDNKYLTQEDIDETDMNEFIYRGIKMRSGDEVKLIIKGNKRLNGIIIGAKQEDGSIHIITHDNEVVKCKIDNILKFKVVNKYGSFF